ncbi:MAG: RNA polymerase factor sigma-54 [Bacteroidales bacterium]|nr:RNA polymerase factor sigma-54 [Bacteroidales bacterium]
MSTTSRQTQTQQLKQKMSPQQIQLMKLVQLSSIALEQRIKEEIESNPALEQVDDDEHDVAETELNLEQETEESWEQDSESSETDYEKESDAQNEFDLSDYIDENETPEYKLYTNNNPEENDREDPYSSGDSFHERLLQQLRLRPLTEKEQLIGEQIIGSIDDSGYLSRDPSAIANDLLFTANLNVTIDDVLDVLEVIQDFDPAGVGARNLQECLLLQLKQKEQNSLIIQAQLILTHFFEEFSKRHYDQIIKKTKLTENELKNIINEILKLNPKPGGSFENVVSNTQVIIPDFIITSNNDKLELSLNNKNLPELHISRDYSEMLDHYSKAKVKNVQDKEALLFVKQKIDAARWFMDSIKQRYSTLEIVMQSIMDYQKDYFLTGDDTQLKPMRLKDIADIVHMDISTISRVANSKFAQTPFGTFSVKSFFSESMENEEGESVSTREIQQILTECIEKEDKKRPLTDEKMVDILKEKGYIVARRTVAKYREVLGIQPARLRKKL